MKKLELTLESLRVESFVTSAVDEKRGTVHAREIFYTQFCNTNDSACFADGTACWPACGGDDTDGCQSTNETPSECRGC